MDENRLVEIEQKINKFLKNPWSLGSEDQASRMSSFVIMIKSDIPCLIKEIRLQRQIIEDQQKESGLFEEGIKKGIDKFAAEYYQIVKFLPSDWHTFKRRIDETVEKLKKELNENKPTE